MRPAGSSTRHRRAGSHPGAVRGVAVDRRHNPGVAAGCPGGQRRTDPAGAGGARACADDPPPGRRAAAATTIVVGARVVALAPWVDPRRRRLRRRRRLHRGDGRQPAPWLGRCRRHRRDANDHDVDVLVLLEVTAGERLQRGTGPPALSRGSSTPVCATPTARWGWGLWPPGHGTDVVAGRCRAWCTSTTCCSAAWTWPTPGP